MGQCCSGINENSRANSQEETENVTRHNSEEENSVYETELSPFTENLDSLITDMLTIIRTLVNNDQETPVPLIIIHEIANNLDCGWLEIICSLIRVIPIDDPLGPLVITLVVDDCPLPSKESVAKVCRTLKLSAKRAIAMKSKVTKERNTCITLGCIANKLVGPNSVTLLSKNCLEYLIAHLRVDNDPNIILFALISLEKFAQTNQNKTAIINRLNEEDNHPLLTLESFVGSQDFVWRQVGFCAQWCLDNVFFIEGRKFSYQEVDQRKIKAMLNSKDVSQYLKIAPNGLEARCDSHYFESVRCTFPVDTGCWYYETLIITPGVMQIGWATKNSLFLCHDGLGIGDDSLSIAYDGCRKLMWFNATPSSQVCDVWKPGDILGCLIDVDNEFVSFYLNGELLVKTNSIFLTVKTGFFAAASFMSFQQCKFNFGAEPFAYPPKNVTFYNFNNYGTLTDNEKIIYPRHVLVKQLREMEVDDDSCTICYERKSAIVIHPCLHKGFCYICSVQLLDCPLCRTPIKFVKEYCEEKTEE